MIPLRVTFANGETYLDRWELSPELLSKKMAASKTLPKTSAPDPSTFIEHFEKGLREAGEVLSISLSSRLQRVLTRLLRWPGECWVTPR